MKSVIYNGVLLIALVGCPCLSLSAQDSVADNKVKDVTPANAGVEKTDNKNDLKEKKDAKKKEGKVNERVLQLESQVRKMQAELETLKKLLLSGSQNPTLDEKTAKSDTGVPVAKSPKDRATATASKKKASKNDLSFDVGSYKITPYGIIFFNAYANNNGTNNVDDPLWATSNPAGNASASGRQTRLGVKIEGGRIGDANVSGVVEADFYGGLPAVGVGENMGVLRFRVAKVKLAWEKTSLQIGQDWVIFAPNSPKSLAAAAIPQFAAAGNLWSRLPQIRVERTFGKGFKWQGAVLAPGTGDFPLGGATPLLLQPGTGSASKTPFFQSRISYTNANFFGSGKGGTIGFAGHYGRSRVTSGARSNEIDSWGAAADWNIPLVKRVSLSGEAFYGKNLAGFQGGIFQGYNTDFGTSMDYEGGSSVPGIRGIGTRGGWTQLGWNLPTLDDRLSIYGSMGIDDPHNEDLVTRSGRNFRTRNFGYAFDAIYKVSKNLSLGWEFRRLETSYFFTPKKEANHMNFGAAFKF